MQNVKMTRKQKNEVLQGVFNQLNSKERNQMLAVILGQLVESQKNWVLDYCSDFHKEELNISMLENEVIEE
jgi:hypothetical protein